MRLEWSSHYVSGPRFMTIDDNMINLPELYVFGPLFAPSRLSWVAMGSQKPVWIDTVVSIGPFGQVSTEASQI